MFFTYRLVVVNADTMYGAMQVESVANGQQVVISRPVTFTRVSDN